MHTNPSFPDKKTLRRIAGGDESAFRMVFDHYRPIIYTLSLRYTRNEWIAEEIVQDVFMKVWVNRNALPGIQNFGGWIFTIAEGLTINAVKKLVRDKEKAQLYFSDPLSVDITFDSAEQENHYATILKEAVQQLPARQQETYLLIKEQGLKREEAAKVLNVSPETVKSNLKQAMRVIRAYCQARLGKTALLWLAAMVLDRA